jgi:hypothetical protein
MRCLLPAACLLLIASPLLADEPLPSRPLSLPFAIVSSAEPASFDLLDFREHDKPAAAQPAETQPRTIFAVKHHVGVAAGYDNGIVHGSLGYYITVAELGRWNFGVPSPAIGFGRHRFYDAKNQRSYMREESTVFVSLASVHYRVGYLESIGLNWYVNLEQVFDIRRNMAGSQVGFTFSRK